jgi:NAD(P)-dependent dehydrogenase (short-subunit alcohol dehydrogenase family)
MAGVLMGRAIIVTGVSHDGQVGQAVARALAAEGASLAVVARTRENVEARAREIRETGAVVLPLAADLTDEAQVRDVVERAMAQFQKIDVLVNLAGGLTRYKPATEHTLADWEYEIANNLKTAFLCAREVFPRMRTAGGGSVINFARTGLPQANMVAYNCAKAGVEALTRTLALEGRDANIRVNAIAPGLVDTRSNIEAMKPKDTSRWTRREDLARVAVFLASDASRGITGQGITVAGWGI